MRKKSYVFHVLCQCYDESLTDPLHILPQGKWKPLPLTFYQFNKHLNFLIDNDMKPTSYMPCNINLMKNALVILFLLKYTILFPVQRNFILRAGACLCVWEPFSFLFIRKNTAFIDIPVCVLFVLLLLFVMYCLVNQSRTKGESWSTANLFKPRPATPLARPPPVNLLLAVPRQLFCFASFKLVVLDVMGGFVLLSLLDIQK